MPGTLLRATCRALQNFRGLHNQRPFCGLACTTALRNEKSPQQKLSYIYGERKFSNRFEGLFKSQVRAIDTAPKDSPGVLLSPDVEHLTLNWGEGDIRLSGTWLRHNCHCDLCKQDFSGQRILDVAKLKPPCLIQDAYVQNGDVHILWQGEADHLGKIPLDFLVNNHYTKEKLTYEQRQRDPVYLTGDVPYMHYDELQTPQGVLKWLCHLNEVGLCVMRGVPQETGMVEKVADKIWPIQYTIYGTVFDVVSTPEPINAAYSSVHLAFHTDLAYYQSAPGIQFLHCIRFDQCVQGGDSIFVDAWHTAEEMRHSHPKHFATLCRVPATFQKIH